MESLSDLTELPRDSYELIDLLDRSFPHRCIGQCQPEIHAHRYAGARELIDALVQIKREDLEGEQDTTDGCPA